MQEYKRENTHAHTCKLLPAFIQKIHSAIFLYEKTINFYLIKHLVLIYLKKGTEVQSSSQIIPRRKRLAQTQNEEKK